MVIIIIAVLAALMFPAISRIRALSRRAHCQNNLKQFDLALGAYCYPPVNTYPPRLRDLNQNDVMPELFLCPGHFTKPAPHVSAVSGSSCSYRYEPGLGPGVPGGTSLMFDEVVRYHEESGYNELNTDHSVSWVPSLVDPPFGTTVAF